MPTARKGVGMSMDERVITGRYAKLHFPFGETLYYCGSTLYEPRDVSQLYGHQGASARAFSNVLPFLIDFLGTSR